MKIKEFEKSLEKSNLNKTELAKLLKTSVSTISNWSSRGVAPYWVETWLENYIKAKSYNDVKIQVLNLFNDNNRLVATS